MSRCWRSCGGGWGFSGRFWSVLPFRRVPPGRGSANGENRPQAAVATVPPNRQGSGQRMARHCRAPATKVNRRRQRRRPMPLSHPSQRRISRRYRSLANHFCGRLPSHAQPGFAQRKRNTGRTQLSSRSSSRRWIRTSSVLPHRGQPTPSPCVAGAWTPSGGYSECDSGIATPLPNTHFRQPPSRRSSGHLLAGSFRST